MVQSEKQRVTSPDVNEADLATLVDGNSAFAFDLYQVLREAEGNLFYSPHTISLALAMAYAGARGETAQQVDGIIGRLEHRQVTLAMPRFEFESSFGLKRALTVMGMPVVFSASADFSGSPPGSGCLEPGSPIYGRGGRI